MILLIPIITIFNEKKVLALLGLDLKFEVVFGIIWGPLSYIDHFLYKRQDLIKKNLLPGHSLSQDELKTK
jgi:hypothetical protein